ncbi:MAG: alpha/beta hydrolase [Deltaproteobacteria bacterium]|nr:alpha/beta hydrolase [Deltaproteobacteria bacterium]
MRCYRILILAAICYPLVTCHRDAPKSDRANEATGDAGTDAETAMVTDYPIDDVEVDWFSCSLYEGKDDGRAECSSTPMPLFWDKVDGQTIDVYSKRLIPRDVAGDTQLWLLAGGPGFSSVVEYPSLMDNWSKKYPSLEVYTIDHRGVGYSERLGCPDQEDPSGSAGLLIDPKEFEKCVQYLETEYGETLSAYNCTYSAIDVAAYIHATRNPDKKLIIWGGSYGSYIAQRYLQIYPEQADAMILEGVVPPDVAMFRSDESADEVAMKFFNICAGHALCKSKLGDDPYQFTRALLDKIEAGHCSGFQLTRSMVKEMIMLMLGNWPMNTAIPAMVYKLNRCSDSDLEALAYLFNNFFAGGDDYVISKDPSPSLSHALYMNVYYSEMYWSPDLDEIDIEYFFENLQENTIVGTDLRMTRFEQYERWPKYKDSLYDDKWATSDIPILILQGGLDSATPLSLAMRVGDHFNGPNQTFAAFPFSAHNVVFGSPTGYEFDAPDCGASLYLDFLLDPTAPLDLSCIDQAVPPQFEGNVYLSMLIFGTSDYFESDPKKAISNDKLVIPPMPAHQIAKIRRSFRRRFPNAPTRLVVKEKSNEQH